MLYVIMKVLLLFLIIMNSALAQVSFSEFQSLKLALHSAFIELRPSEKDQLNINLKVGDFDNYWWDLDTVHASYSQHIQDKIIYHNIFLFGGFARLDQMTLDGLALTACHEIGHGLGGAPKKESGSTVEGEADYYASNICLPIVFKYLEDTTPRSQNNYIYRVCANSPHSADKCIRLFTAIESEIAFFETLGDSTYLTGRSSNISTSINRSASYYPDAQCRVDTMIHGILKIERPKCWFPNGTERLP